MSKDVFWTTKDGTKMNVDDMDDNHVRNAFKMLLRNIERLEQKARAKKRADFLIPNGEIAREHHDQMLLEDMGMTEDDMSFDPNWDIGNHIPPKIDY